MNITNAVCSVHVSESAALRMKETHLICQWALMVNPMQTNLPHAFVFKLTSQTRPFLWSRRAFVRRQEAASDPPSESQCIRRAGTLSFHAVTIKHASSTRNNSSVSRSHSIPLETLNKGQLQTCCKLWAACIWELSDDSSGFKHIRSWGGMEILLFV